MVTTDVHLRRTDQPDPPPEPEVPGLAAADQARAMALMTARLKVAFASLPAPVVDEVVDELHRDFEGSRIRAFVPILVERLARDRLAAIRAGTAPA